MPRPDGVETQQLRAEAVQREKASVSFPCGVCAIKVQQINKKDLYTVEEQTNAGDGTGLRTCRLRVLDQATIQLEVCFGFEAMVNTKALARRVGS